MGAVVEELSNRENGIEMVDVPAEVEEERNDISAEEITLETSESKEVQKKPARLRASNNPLYLYISNTIWKGRKEQITLEHLPQLPVVDRIEALRDSKSNEFFDGTTLFKRIFVDERKEFLLAAFMALTCATCQMANPLVFHQFVHSFDCETQVKPVLLAHWFPQTCGDVPFSVMLAGLQFVLKVSEAITNNLHLFLGMHIGQRIRSRFIALVFQKYMNTRPDCRPRTGEVLSIATSEGQMFVESLQYVHFAWTGFLQVGFGTWVLYELFGKWGPFGVLVFSTMVPISVWLSRYSKKARARRKDKADVRIRLCSEMLLGIRVIKYFGWEAPYLARIEALRKEEIKLARNELLIIATLWLSVVIIPMIGMAISILGYVYDGGELHPSTIFGVVAVFIALRFPLMNIGNVVSASVSLVVAWRRMINILKLPARDEIKFLEDEKHLAELKDATIGWHDNIILKDINIALSPGDLHVVLGRVGTGKTTLLNAVIGEARLLTGELYIHKGRTAIVPQEPWVINATLRDNILFGLDLDCEWYHTVLQACALLPDIKSFKHGELEEIGERGITLSGGQKQRVCLARAVYAKCPLILLDDVLAKLDPKTAVHVYKHLLAPGGLLRNSAIILTTNQPKECRDATTLTVLSDSSQTLFTGNLDALHADTNEHLDFLRNGINEATNISSEEETEDEGLLAGTNVFALKSDMLGQIKSSQNLMTVEKAAVGTSFSGEVIKTYLKPIGGLIVFLLWFSSLFAERFFTCFETIWIGAWSRAGAEGILSTSEEDHYRVVYIIVLSCAVFFVCFDRISYVFLTTKCAYGSLNLMLRTLVCCPMGWFETTPVGRILHRITFDAERLDLMFPEKMLPALLSTSWMAGAVIMCVIVLGPLFILVLLPPAYVYFKLFFVARKGIRDMQRLDSLTRSPIQSHLLEAIDGCASIRAFGRHDAYVKLLDEHTDKNARCIFAFNGSTRWLGVRTESLAAFINFLVGLFLSLLRHQLDYDASGAGVVIVWANTLTITVAFQCLYWSLAEANFTAVERIVEYSHSLPQEDVLTTTITTPTTISPTWPSTGTLEINNVTMRYRQGLPFALTGISFTINPGERVAVVGRSGAGKSSLAVMLFRIVEREGGSVMLDGVDVSDVPLTRLRQAIGIITQDALVFNGTVRYNLDPFDNFTDDQCNSILKSVNCPMPLDRVIDAGEISVGERQLLCLTRALLRKPALLICDEATASVDLRTDERVQKALRSELERRPTASLLTIAHRLETVMDYPRVLVMARGKVVDSGRPIDLLKSKGKNN